MVPGEGIARAVLMVIPSTAVTGAMGCLREAQLTWQVLSPTSQGLGHVRHAKRARAGPGHLVLGLKTQNVPNGKRLSGILTYRGPKQEGRHCSRL